MDMIRLASPRPFPRALLYAAGTMIVASITIAAVARQTDFGATRLQYTTPVESREIRFIDRIDGSVVVLDGKDASVIDVVEPGTKGFIRTVMRGLAHTRTERGFGPEGSFQLTRWEDGRLSIADPLTGRHVELVGFGTTNAQVFANLLASGRNSQ